MTENTLPFSDDYPKLDHKIFPTIRRRDKYGSTGDTNTITCGSKGSREALGKAKIVAKEKTTLDDLSDQFLLFDTNSSGWDEAYETLNKFYQNPIEPDEELTLYWNSWVDRYE